jgi:hypothetical protein
MYVHMDRISLQALQGASEHERGCEAPLWVLQPPHSHRTATAQLLHSHRTATAQPPHSYYTAAAQLQAAFWHESFGNILRLK